MSDSHYLSNSSLTALKISLIYFIISFIWILASDQLVSMYITNPQLIILSASIKGTLFIIFTSLLIYFLVSRDIKKRERAEKALIKSERQLKISMDLAKVVQWIYDVESDMFTFDDQFYALYGTTVEEEGGAKMSSEQYAKKFIPPEEAAVVEKAIIKSLKSDDPDYVDIIEHSIIRADGEKRFIIVRLGTIKDEKGRTIKAYGANQDITERKLTENQIKESLKEKELLLREIHHRVKNNLQIISSMLNLQAEYVEGDESLNILTESKNRVQTMALIHEELYRSSSLKEIKFKDFIYSLTSNIFYSYDVDIGKIKRIIDVDDLNVGIDTAIPCGLIINELVTNSLKYAFQNGKGAIKVELKKKGDEYSLILEDDGIGLPEDIKIEDTETLGLKMVESLVYQLDGTMELDRSNGTKFIITFEELEYANRI